MNDILFYPKEFFSKFTDHKCSQASAALSYYAIFSIAPLLTLVVAITGIFVNSTEFLKFINNELAAALGNDAAQQILAMTKGIPKPSFKSWESFVAVSLLAVGSTGLLLQIQYVLNDIWQIQAAKKIHFIKSLIIKRSLSFLMIIVFSFLLLLSFVLSAILASVGTQVQSYLPEWFFLSNHIVSLIRFIFGLIPTFLLFTLMYKFLPDTEVRWKDTILGSLIAALYVSFGRTFLGLYLSQKDIASS